MAQSKYKIKKTAVVKRKYDAQRKNVARGKSWKYPLEMENDVAKLVLGDIDQNPNGIVLNKLLNNKLREAYNIEPK